MTLDAVDGRHTVCSMPRLAATDVGSCEFTVTHPTFDGAGLELIVNGDVDEDGMVTILAPADFDC